jgi:plastocyanin
MRSIGVTVAALVALALAGCGGSESEPAAKSTTSTPSATASASAEPAAGPTTVKIVNFDYSPKTVTVKAGARITWKNADTANHTVTFKGGPGDLGNVDQNKRLKARFPKAGRFPYICQYHPNMHGTVVVQ